jgi:LysM repeat protein
MDEAARIKRNNDRITECFPAFGPRIRAVLDALEAQQFRPRIQDAYRSPEDQLKAFNGGFSKVKFGFHNITGDGGVKEALACDVLDDDSPLAPGTRYLLALAAAARSQGLQTGILWGLPAPLAAGVEGALATGDISSVIKVGWDPTHTEVAGLSITSAKAGGRPTFADGGQPVVTPPVVSPLVVTPPVVTPPVVTPPVVTPAAVQIHVVQSGDTLTRIAKLHGLTLARVLELNPQFAPNPNLIRIGDQVLVG